MWQIRPGLETLKPYSVEETAWKIRLDANERPANLPPAVRDEVAARLAALPFHRYPDMHMTTLRTMIARSLGVTAGQVLIGSGSSEILAVLCQIFGGRDRHIVFPAPSFSMYGIYAKLSDSRPAVVQLETDFSLDREKVLAAAAKTEAGLIILCTPNNPTGNVIPLPDIEYILSRASCPVIVDEAYQEFAAGPSALSLLGKYPNLIVARTFSKAYGLASARVGYMVAGEALAREVSKVLLPYHVNALSLTAAEVVYARRDDFAPGIREIIAERERLSSELSRVKGLTVFPSATNFLLVQAQAPELLLQCFRQGEIGVRDFSKASGLTGCVRITVGTAAENDSLLAAARQYGKDR
ncbi:aminotransferases class-ii pyridoxal-phosphate attachment site [Lucifera butyrica]|uniref:Histidinol-phosphate aminotransferase n=1 Tax=Lucifera butyrica TaxID=1351585 RepID=A0A498R4X1_9FIRM|nr:histidinol-phosphate transaminase [Lucifera butyrica]VBB05867.1 aminotransferases class-ii pyridoxal-phosphate attachment site [Lucifera butyrica]